MTPDERTQLMKALHDHLWDSALYNKGDWWTLLEAYTCEIERGVWEETVQTLSQPKPDGYYTQLVTQQGYPTAYMLVIDELLKLRGSHTAPLLGGRSNS